MRVTKFDIECANRLREARERIPCSADVPVLDADGNVVDYTTGPERMAEVDITRLTAAKVAEREANTLATHRRKGDVLTAAEAEDEAKLRAETSRQRAMVRSFEKDREDIVLRRGRNKPVAVHSPARPFASSTEAEPTDLWACPECGWTWDEHNAACKDYRCTRRGHTAPVAMLRVWVRPAQAERWALVQARAEALDGVEYDRVVDQDTGVWLYTVAVTHRGDEAVGYGALLEIGHCAPTGPRDPYRIAVSRQALVRGWAHAKIAQTEAVEAAVARADALRQVEAEVAAHDRRCKARTDLALVQAQYGGCEQPTVLPATPRRKRTRRGRKGSGKGDRSTQVERRETRRATGGQTTQRAYRKVLAAEIDRKAEGRYYAGRALGSKRSV